MDPQRGFTCLCPAERNFPQVVKGNKTSLVNLPCFLFCVNIVKFPRRTFLLSNENKISVIKDNCYLDL